MIRIRSGRTAADSEYGFDAHHRSRVRNRTRKNWPDSARSSSRCRPVSSTDTTPGASGTTCATRSRCRSACRTGVDEPVPDDRRGHRGVERRPGDPGGPVVDEVGAGRELVAERQRDREVGVEVQVVPGLVAHPAAGGPGRDDADPDQQQPGDRRHEHVRVAQQQRRGLADHVGVRGDRVPPDDQQAVRRDQADRVAAAHRVPAGQPVGADAALQRRDAGHQRDQHDHGVAGQQTGDPPGVGEPVTEPADRRRVGPPQPDGRRGSGRDQGEQGGRVRARRRPGPRRSAGESGPDRTGRGRRRRPRPLAGVARHRCVHVSHRAGGPCPQPWPFLGAR